MVLYCAIPTLNQWLFTLPHDCTKEEAHSITCLGPNSLPDPTATPKTGPSSQNTQPVCMVHVKLWKTRHFCFVDILVKGCWSVDQPPFCKTILDLQKGQLVHDAPG